MDIVSKDTSFSKIHFNFQPILPIYGKDNYNWKVKDDDLIFKDESLAGRLDRLKYEYKIDGLRRSVQLVMLVHEHNIAHVLLFQRGHALFMLPSDDIELEENELDTAKRILQKFLGVSEQEATEQYEIVDLLSRWWRPNFEPPLYPYVAAHVTAPKEVCSQFLVKLPQHANFSIPKNLNIVSVPLMELFGNAKSYGAINSSLPTVLNRYQMNLL